MNLRDVTKTPMHIAYEAVKSIVNDHGVETCGSELVGLVPLSAMIESGRWYADASCEDEVELVQAAIKGLGLDSLGNSTQMRESSSGHLRGSEKMKTPWMEMTVRDFQAALASSSPTPGGGTAAAIALGQASALTIMVCDLTIGKEKWKDGWGIAEKALLSAVKI